jgi:dUTP pyrophosphatase
VKVNVINISKYSLPEYKTQDAAGLDLIANIPTAITLPSLERQLVPTGLFMALPKGTEGQVRPRSGLALKQGLTVLNAPGTIDADYRGEVKVLLINLSKEDIIIHPGDRIAQLVVSTFIQIAWQEVQTLDETIRGEGGYGHTGK